MISVIVPCFKPSKSQFVRLYDSVINQSYRDFELIIVDDNSQTSFYDEVVYDHRAVVVYKTANTGPADSRNFGAGKARNDILFFTDSDCKLGAETLRTVADNIEKENILVGDTVTEARTRLGKLVSHLGFPGGGGIGFENVWKVDHDGYTKSISSCNLAIRKNVFFNTGMFDSSFPVAGGEDTVFARTVIDNGYRIKYVKQQIIYHVEVESFHRFLQWQITRGRGNYHIKRRLGRVGGFFLLRIWSFKNSLFKAGLWSPVVLVLIFLAVIYQTKGYQIEKRKNELL